jgi:hypothetical protein
MEIAFAQPARFAAFEDSAPIVLRDVEDLHDADLDAVLADRLTDGQAAAEVAASLAQLVVRPGSALLAHDLRNSAELLAVC